MRDFLHEVGGGAVIDGGLATELEANGVDLNDPFWSPKCLISSPHFIRKAYAELLEKDNINSPAWFSFNSKDGVDVVSGDSLIECASIADSCKKVMSVGVNCTPPRFIQGLILSIKKVIEKPILIYPNSGERYDANKKKWVDD